MDQGYVKGLLSTGEVVLIDTRQHWIAALRFALRPIVILIIGLVLLYLSWTIDTLNVLETIIEVATAILLVVSIIWLPIDLIRWWSRHYILTNRRAMRMEGVLRKKSIDSSLEHINDIRSEQSFIGRTLGYADLTLYTASDTANEQYEQLLDGLTFKRAVLDAKEAIRKGQPLERLPDGFIVKGGTNEASMRADGKIEQAAVQVAPPQVPPEVGEGAHEAHPILQEDQPSPAIAGGDAGEPEAAPEAEPAPWAPTPDPSEAYVATDADHEAFARAEDDALAEAQMDAMAEAEARTQLSGLTAPQEAVPPEPEVIKPEPDVFAPQPEAHEAEDTLVTAEPEASDEPEPQPEAAWPEADRAAPKVAEPDTEPPAEPEAADMAETFAPELEPEPVASPDPVPEPISEAESTEAPDDVEVEPEAADAAGPDEQPTVGDEDRPGAS